MTPPAHFDESSIRPPMPIDRSPAIGCIGAGFVMTDCHLPAYRAAGFNAYAITARSAERAADVAARHGIPNVYGSVQELLEDPVIQILDIAVPPDITLSIIRQAVGHAGHIRGILAQKPLGIDFQQTLEAVRLCEEAGIVLSVNQNMRYDQSMRACKNLLDRGLLGEPILATIEMRAVPHWMPWHQRQGFLTLRNMSVHHLDALRFLFGDPDSIFASVRQDPRTARSFDHTDGIRLYILEYENGLRASGLDDVWAGPGREGAAEDTFVHWRVEGTDGLAKGTVGWPRYPEHTPSTIDFTTILDKGEWHRPRWSEAWFPEAFQGPMAQLLIALETGAPPDLSGGDNLRTMALVDAAYMSVRERRPVSPAEVFEAHSITAR